MCNLTVKSWGTKSSLRDQNPADVCLHWNDVETPFSSFPGTFCLALPATFATHSAEPTVQPIQAVVATAA